MDIFLKWWIKIVVKSLNLFTKYFNVLLVLSLLILPIPPKNACNWYNSNLSHWFKVIVKKDLIRQPVLHLLF